MAKAMAMKKCPGCGKSMPSSKLAAHMKTCKACKDKY